MGDKVRAQASTTTRRRAAAFLLVALTGAAFATGPAAAHETGASGEHGALVVATDSERCTVRVEAHDVNAGAANLRVLDSSDGTVLTFVRVTGTAAGAGFSYAADVGLTSAEAARADRVVLSFHRDGEEHAASATFDSFDCEQQVFDPTCPVVTEVRSEDADDPKVRFTIHVVNATGFRIYRSTDGGPFEFQEQVLNEPQQFNQIFHVDEDVEGGVTYTYRLSSVNANGESPGCAENTVTAIPFFGAPLLFALAAVGGVGAYVVVRRRT